MPSVSYCRSRSSNLCANFREWLVLNHTDQPLDAGGAVAQQILIVLLFVRRRHQHLDVLTDHIE